MIERICPACQHGNPLDDRYCGKCGVPLERQLPARRDAAPMVVAGRQLPVTWQQFGRTVALSAAAVVAEVGLSWLRHKMETGTPAPTALARSTPAVPAPETTAMSKNPVSSVVTIVSQRVIEVWESADGKKQISERHFWRRTEE
ncbi:MAG: zinc ribbon domain-containing protein [Chloroflexi bacterium SZAS-1]|jgi:hypothetical protein|nr:zinc ribbon domain-containing protein [Chloroflexi bacterium SZAS-1]HNP85465.1 zinc ribbon domain-containing protein [Kouleothrix sp.]